MTLFDRLLIDNEEWYVGVAWLGIGAVNTVHKPTGRTAQARGAAKTYFLDLCQELQHRKSLEPGNPLFVKCVTAFAHAVTLPGWEAEILMDQMVTRPAIDFVRRVANELPL